MEITISIDLKNWWFRVPHCNLDSNLSFGKYVLIDPSPKTEEMIWDFSKSVENVRVS